MTEEIKKLIEEEAENYKIGMLQRHTDIIDKFSDSIQYFTADDIKEARLSGCESILSKWQEAERWRKVGEHRPAVDEHLMYSYTCLVRLESGAYAIAVYHSCGAWMESGTEEYLDTVIEWKPIS